MNAILDNMLALFQHAYEIWISGGWAMLAIAGIALVIFALGMHVNLRLNGKGFTTVKTKTWRHWVNNPNDRNGYIGELLDYVMGGSSLKDTALSFDELRATEIEPFERDLRVMKICVGVAPLLGLLGTVTGMLSTFSALAAGSGGEKTMELVARGISEALITTETGLVIALPGLFFQYQLSRKLEQFKAFFASIESVCIQTLYKKQHHMATEVTVPKAKKTDRHISDAATHTPMLSPQWECPSAV